MPSDLYHKLAATAHEFIHSMDSDPATGVADAARVRAVRTADYRQHYGHPYFMHTARPGHVNSYNIDTIVEHLHAAAPLMDLSAPDIRHVLVDESRREAALRMAYTIGAKGGDEKVEYEIFWLLIMDQEGGKVRTATEFIDGYASARVSELVAEQLDRAEE